MIATTREYRAIEAHYRGRTARRSGEPLIRHIDQGLRILRAIEATEQAMRAYCIHPLLQADEDLAVNHLRLSELSDDPRVLVLAMEYRNIANATLSTRPLSAASDIRLSPLPEVNDMLVADKVQNRADFVRHHLGVHPRSDELQRYFALWLERLGVDDARYEQLVQVASDAGATPWSSER